MTCNKPPHHHTTYFKKKNSDHGVMDMSLINLQFLKFKLTYNLCEFENVIIKSLTMLFSLYKTCLFFKKLQVLIFPNMIRYNFFNLFLQCC